LLQDGLLDELPAGAIVVNIAQPVIEGASLIEVLADGHLGGACLDVVTVEPSPKDSPLWNVANVIIPLNPRDYQVLTSARPSWPVGKHPSRLALREQSIKTK
jgi:hypothetical protein